MEKTLRDESYIDLWELAGALLRRWLLIALVTAVCAAGAYAYSAYVITPLYSARAMMIVNSGERSPDYVSSDQLASSAKLLETYSVIIRSDTVTSEVISNLGMEDTYGSTVRGITVSSVNDTQIMRITVTATDPEIALDVCREITNVAPDVIIDAMEAGSVKLISAAKTSWVPVSPNVTRNTMYGAVVGFLLTCGIIVLFTILNNKVKSESDISQMDLALLGVIPTYELGGNE